jgi:hypothetical protein
MEQTPFKAVFTKKSNFVTQSFDTDPLVIEYGADSKFLVPRHGDFITKMYLLIDYTSSASSKINHALAMLDHVSLIIGGNTIQQESGETINLRLNVQGTEKESFSVVQLFRMLGGGPSYPFSSTSQYPRAYRLQVPLQFWFHGKPDLAIPLAALRYQEVEVEVALRNSENWGGSDSDVKSSDVRLRIEYGYAPDEVVKSVMRRPLIFPTEQFQLAEKEYTGDTSFTLKPYFVNPVKAVFALFKDKTTDTTNIFDYSRGNALPLSSVDQNDFLTSMEVVLDNEVLMPKEVGTFEMYRGFQYYAHFPGSAQDIVFGPNRYCGFIYALAFCKDPMNRTVPNGSINFSTIINPLFNVECKGNSSNAIRFRLYALSMNLLYIENGISRLLFTGSEATLPRFP